MKRTQWKEIWDKKRETQSQLRQASDNYLTAIYEGIAKNEPIKALLKHVRQIKSLNLRMGLPYDPECERYALHIAKDLKRRQPASIGIDPITLSVYAIKEMQRRDVFSMTSKMANAYARGQEARAKEELIRNSLKEEEERIKEELKKKNGADTAEILLSAKIFYLCSSHGDCAEDHEEWQGKLYYDRFWRKWLRGKSKKDTEKVSQIVFDLIAKNRMKSLQWVTNRPVWLTTRPNCRHYFSQVSIKEAMSNDTDELLDEKGMRHKVGLRDSQTLRHSTKAQWYTASNIETIIKKYQERLALHEKMLKAQPNDTLRGYIDKDKRLIKKWKYLLSKR